jgi:hypothetical protein
MVKFRFGDKQLPSSFHQKAILDKIPGFRADLERIEPDTNEIQFPEDMADTIALLIQWVYTSNLPKLTSSTSPDDCYLRIMLYCLAVKYQQADLMNESMDFIMGYLRKNLPRWDVHWTTYTYNNTPQGCPLRILMAKWCAQKFVSTEDKGRWTTDNFAQSVSGHPDLLYDVLQHLRMHSTIKITNPKKDDPASYHIDFVLPQVGDGSTDNAAIFAEGSIDTLVENKIDAPTDSDTEIYEAYSEGGSDFGENGEETASEIGHERFPLTRGSHKKGRAGKRSFTAPA